jgi:hypothetical protein
MPVAHASSLDITPPGTTRRRVWVHPEVKSHSLVVLTFDRLQVMPLAEAPKPEVVAAVESGGDLTELLGPSAVDIDLDAVRQVKLDLLTNSLLIEYAKDGTNTTQLTVTFTSSEAADACFTKLWRRLGDAFQLQPYQRDAWSAARSPLVLLIGGLLTTALLALVLSVFEDMASARAAAQLDMPDSNALDGAKNLPKSPLEVLLGWMDWRWVCAFGGVVAAIAQVWLYRRLTRPPVALELKRS